MAKVLVIYHSYTGNTEEMAKAIMEGLQRMEVEVELIHATEVDDARIRDALESADGLLFGSPTFVRDVPPQMWRVLSLLSTVKLRAKLAAHGFTVMQDTHSSLSFGYGLSLFGLSFPIPSTPATARSRPGNAGRPGRVRP